MKKGLHAFCIPRKKEEISQLSFYFSLVHDLLEREKRYFTVESFSALWKNIFMDVYFVHCELLFRFHSGGEPGFTFSANEDDPIPDGCTDEELKAMADEYYGSLVQETET